MRTPGERRVKDRARSVVRPGDELDGFGSEDRPLPVRKNSAGPMELAYKSFARFISEDPSHPSRSTVRPAVLFQQRVLPGAQERRQLAIRSYVQIVQD